MVSLHCVEKGRTLGLHALGWGTPKHLQKTRKVSRLKALKCFQGF